MKDIGKLFMEYTKYQHLGPSEQSQGVPQPPLELEPISASKLIKLPDPAKLQLGEMPVKTAIETRKSLREYADTPMTLEELSYLLWCTQGVRETVDRGGKVKVAFRNVPSAGCRHAFETYLLINRVEGLTPGLYKYMALENKLAELNTSADIADRVVSACMGQGFIQSANATFIWVAVPSRMKWRYGQRGYRYMLLDAGHVCQNLYISAESIDCGACAIAAYSDEEINSLLGLDGEEQFVIYIGTAGRK